MKPTLTPAPPRIAKLPLSDEGYPIPFFVDYIDGKPDFRTMDARKWTRCVRERLCWVCGEKLGGHLAFPIGPMCAINRTISEPPSHRDCAIWSLQNCPFINNPSFHRRDATDLLDQEDYKHPAGFAIMRNPGVMCLWMTRDYEVFDDGNGGRLITIGEPTSVTWWREGREATRAEVQESIDTGLPALLAVAKHEGKFAVQALEKFVQRAEPWLPPWPTIEAHA